MEERVECDVHDVDHHEQEEPCADCTTPAARPAQGEKVPGAAGEPRDDPEQNHELDRGADGDVPLVRGVRVRRSLRQAPGPVHGREHGDEREPRDQPRAVRVVGCRVDTRLGLYATQFHSAHCVTKTPRRIALQPTMAACARAWRPPSQASARKNGNTTSPKRGSERSGQRELGALSGSARLTAAKSPYGAPNSRHAITASTTKSVRNAKSSRLSTAVRSGVESTGATAVQ